MHRFPLVFCALTLLGCGGEAKPSYPTVKVTGTMVLLGLPLKAGSISFMPEPGTKGAAVGGEISNGAYSFTNFPKGTHQGFVHPGAEKPLTVLSSGDVAFAVEIIQLPAKFAAGLVTDVSKDGPINFDIPRESSPQSLIMMSRPSGRFCCSLVRFPTLFDGSERCH